MNPPNTLARWRRLAGWSQAELAQRSGVNAVTISRIETLKEDPRLSTVLQLVDALELGIPTSMNVKAYPTFETIFGGAQFRVSDEEHRLERSGNATRQRVR